jgi:hypothetical protein
MSEGSADDEPHAGDGKSSVWSRMVRAVLPDKIGHRWARLPEGSQQDAAHYNMRSGL